MITTPFDKDFIHKWESWIGRRQKTSDLICPVLARRMAATLFFTTPGLGEALSHLWHWMFFQPELPSDQLGRDGHPALEKFLPPSSNRNRMWAAGEFVFFIL